MRCAPRPPRQSGWRTAARSRRDRHRCGLRPRPAPSSPSTINSGSGGAAPICQTSARSPIVSTSSGVQEKRQAFVAADMVMGADVFVAGMADQDRSRHQLEEPAAASATEAALAHIGDRVAVDTAPRTACRPAPALQRKSDTEMDPRCRSVVARHAANLGLRARRSNREQHVEQRLAADVRCARPRSTAAGAWRWRRRSARSCRHSCRLRARDGRAR